MPKDPHALVWLDLETTGLDDRSCVILEIATAITDKDLETVAEGPDLVVHQPEAVLARMDPWCVEQHGASGLTTASRRSIISLEQAEQATLAFVRSRCLRGRAPLCGNSIGFDRRFLIHHMPTLNAYLSYRNVDVSSLKELVTRWYPGAVELPNKRTTHRAAADLRESIDELRLYRQQVFRERR